MSKTTAPLLSFGAGGQIAKTQVYSSWRGISYVRKYVIPSNPNTIGQQAVRSVFAWATGTWKTMSTLSTAPWTAFAKGKPLTDRNAFIGQNVKRLNGLAVLTSMIFSPGAGGGPQPTSIGATGGSGEVTVTSVNPTPPVGWTITSFVAQAVLQGDPATLTSSAIFAGNDTSTFDHVVISGLAAGTYVIGGYLVYSKGAGVLAYSPSINVTATVT